MLAAGAVTALGLMADAIVSGPGGVPASAAGAGTDTPDRFVVVRAGDTLWSIAEAHHGDINLRRYVEKLIDLNGDSTRIVIGQTVQLP